MKYKGAEKLSIKQHEYVNRYYYWITGKASKKTCHNYHWRFSFGSLYLNKLQYQYHLTAIIQGNMWEPVPPLKNRDFLEEKFCCLQALADSNHHIRIKEKMLEFSTVLPALYPYLLMTDGQIQGHGMLHQHSRVR